MATVVDLDLLTGDDRIISEAKNRFTHCEAWEADFRKAYIDDVKFAHADAVNMYAWPNAVRRNRDIDERPCLTINKVHQHNLQIINGAKQNKPSIKIRPTGGDASADSANIYEGIVRRIEYQSNATAAYDTATQTQVDGGIGYWRVVTAYASEDVSPEAFDQEIYIRRIKDPLNVYIDPDINEVDGSDARFGFLFDNMPTEEFNKKYPKHKNPPVTTTLGESANSWVTIDHVRVAEYYRRVDHKKMLVAFTDPTTGETQVLLKKDIPKELLGPLLADPATRTREITEPEIEWYLLAGDEIIDRNIWPGKYIPIVRVIGEETIIDGELDRKGHTRNLLDPQRIYNYWSSSAVEFVALQGKQPFVGAAGAIEGYETYWETANRINYSILPYKNRDDEGNEIPAPQREQPPQMAQAYIVGMQVSANEMQMASGQYQAVMGEKSNETSGKAINERQRQGETATYHFIDNLAHGIRYTGRIILDLIPKIYDTPRVLKILAENGDESEVHLDPKAAQAYEQKRVKLTDEVKHIFNPNVGRYDVQADIGPNYGTRRQEAFNAFSQIVTQSPQMMALAGDLLFKSADFPGAEDIAERLKRMVPAQALGEGIPPEVQSLQQQVQHFQQIIQKLMEELGSTRSDLKNKDNEAEVRIYDAITTRMKVLMPQILNPHDIALEVSQLLQEEQKNNLLHSRETASIENDRMALNQLDSTGTGG